MTIMNSKLIRSFLIILSFAVFSGNALAEKAETEVNEIAAYQDEIDAAISLGDESLVASIIAKAVAQNPEIAGSLVSYVVAQLPQASVAIIAAVQNVAPKAVAKVTKAITAQLAKNPANQAVLAKVLAATSTASGGDESEGENEGGDDNGDNNNGDNGANNRGARGRGDLPDAVEPNESQVSDS